MVVLSAWLMYIMVRNGMFLKDKEISGTKVAYCGFEWMG